MKLKLQFDQKAIQEFLLQNVEKIGLGIVVCVFLFMVYSAVSRSRSRTGRRPTSWSRRSSRDRTRLPARDPDSALITMTNLTAEEYKKKYEEGYGKKEGEQYVARAEGSRVPIQPKPYATEKDIDPAVVPAAGAARSSAAAWRCSSFAARPKWERSR